MAIVIPYVKQPWTDGSGGGTPVSAARLGVIEEGILDASLAPCVRVFHNTTQSVTSGTPLALAFNSERFDQAGGASSTMHDTVTNNSRLTAIYAGVYQISGTIQYAASPQITNLSIRVNGTTTIARHGYVAGTALDVRYQHISTLYALAVNDYVELIAAQTSGGAVNVNSVGNESPEFMMVRVG